MMIIEKGILKSYAATRNGFEEGMYVRHFINPKFQHVVIPHDVKVIGGIKDENDGNRFSHDLFYRPFMYNLTIQSVEMSDDVIEIGDKAFEHCANLVTLQLSKNLKRIGFNAFLYCKKLKRFDIYPGLEEIVENAFIGCESLKEVVFHGTYQQFKSIKMSPRSFDPKVKIKTLDRTIEIIFYEDIKEELKPYLNTAQPKKKI